MSQALMNFLGQSLGKGQATGGTKTTLLDTRKVFVDGMLNGKIIRMTIGGIDYYRTITGTTASTSTITFPTLPGTPASCAWTAVAGHVITTTCVADGGNDYTIVAALAEGNNKPLAVTLVGNVITIALATGAGGASNDAANTTTLVAAAIDALAEFTSSVTSGDGSGVVAATSAPVAFTGGVDEVKPVAGTHYEVVGGIGSAVSLSGSNVADGTVSNGVSFEVDTGGYNVLRVVDAAPFAYDSAAQSFRVINKESDVEDVVFHDAAVVAADGTAFVVGGYKTLTVEILSTATSFTIAFIGEGPSGADIPLMGINLSTLTTGVNTSTSGQLWQFDITGLTKVFMDLTAITAGPGSVTVKGKAVA
jgi:hypothetical protein